jgi:hypothetical protein
MTPRAKLLTKIFEQGFRTPDWRHNDPPPVVTLEDFFEGNTRPDSIAVNLSEHPGLGFFYGSLKQIRARPDVQAVLANIYDLSDIIFGDADGWPYCENIHILTSASEAEIQNWAEALKSDGASEGWPYGESPHAPKASTGQKWWSISWD